MVTLTGATLRSPLGELLLVAANGELCALEYADYQPRCHAYLSRYFGAEEGLRHSALPTTVEFTPIIERLQAYFAGDLIALDKIPTAVRGTDFCHKIWRELRTIPPGQIVSYGALATRLDQPGAARSVGGAVGRNPIAILIPCHRVVGSTGSLTGYAGGLGRKTWLLSHEKHKISATDPVNHIQTA